MGTAESRDFVNLRVLIQASGGHTPEGEDPIGFAFAEPLVSSAPIEAASNRLDPEYFHA